MPDATSSYRPSASIVLGGAILTWAAYVSYRTFIQRHFPYGDNFGYLVQDLLITLGRLACAGTCYALARWRYARAILHGGPGSPRLAWALGFAFVAAQASLSWGRALGGWDRSGLLFRAIECLIALAVAANEEIGYRGALFLSAQELGGDKSALLLTTLLFAGMHIGYQRPEDLLHIGLYGLGFGLARLRGVSLFQLVMIHFAVDAYVALIDPGRPEVFQGPYVLGIAILAVTALVLFKAPTPERPLVAS